MDSSEELLLLRARIAKLERQQTMNSPTSSSADFDLLAQNGKRRRIEGGIDRLTLAWSSVFAERPIPKEYFGIFYYEVKMLGRAVYVSIGFTPKQIPLNKVIGGPYEGSYAYGSDGKFWGHAVLGCSNWNGRPYIKGKPTFGVRDVIGCGINLATRQIIYTKNGQRLDTANLFISFATELFPCVTLFHSGDKIEANFGPNFEFKF